MVMGCNLQDLQREAPTPKFALMALGEIVVVAFLLVLHIIVQEAERVGWGPNNLLISIAIFWHYVASYMHAW